MNVIEKKPFGCPTVGQGAPESLPNRCLFFQSLCSDSPEPITFYAREIGLDPIEIQPPELAVQGLVLNDGLQYGLG